MTWNLKKNDLPSVHSELEEGVICCMVSRLARWPRGRHKTRSDPGGISSSPRDIFHLFVCLVMYNPNSWVNNMQKKLLFDVTSRFDEFFFVQKYYSDRSGGFQNWTGLFRALGASFLTSLSLLSQFTTPRRARALDTVDEIFSNWSGLQRVQGVS